MYSQFQVRDFSTGPWCLSTAGWVQNNPRKIVDREVCSALGTGFTEEVSFFSNFFSLNLVSSTDFGCGLFPL